jgi:hypothetical protein
MHIFKFFGNRPFWGPSGPPGAFATLAKGAGAKQGPFVVGILQVTSIVYETGIFHFGCLGGPGGPGGHARRWGASPLHLCKGREGPRGRSDPNVTDFMKI